MKALTGDTFYQKKAHFKRKTRLVMFSKERTYSRKHARTLEEMKALTGETFYEKNAHVLKEKNPVQ